MENKNVLALDAGFGDVKICLDQKFSKELSAIAKLEDNPGFKDENYIEFENSKYYVFSTAAKLPISKQISINNYEDLKFATPIYIKAIELKYGIKVEKLCVGLSIAMNNYAEDFKKHISTHSGIDISKIYLLPQGVGSKIAYTAYNLDFEDSTMRKDRRSQNYIGIDIGFNTVDVFQCIDNKLSINAIKGYENYGLISVAKKLIEETNSKGIPINMSVAKEILSTFNLRYRGDTYNFSDFLTKEITNYIVELFKFIESQFNESIDRMDNILLVGGGAALIKSFVEYSSVRDLLKSMYGEGFIIIPNNPEYYNVLGYYYYAMNQKQ